MTLQAPLRVWLIADTHNDSIAALKGTLQKRGTSVEVLELNEALERTLRQRGSELLDTLRGFLNFGGRPVAAEGGEPASLSQDEPQEPTAQPSPGDASTAPSQDEEQGDADTSEGGDESEVGEGSGGDEASAEPSAASEAAESGEGASAFEAIGEPEAAAEEAPVLPPGDDAEAFKQALSRGAPDLVVFTSPRHLKGMDWVGRVIGGDALKVALLPDYNLGGAWLKGAVHAFVIPHEGLRAPLHDAGVAPERVFVAGPAIARSYAEAPDAEALRAEFGLDPSAGAITLILTSHFSASTLESMLFQLSLVDKAWQPIFHVGRDEEKAEALRRAARTHGLPARLLGDVANLHDFIAAAELILLHPTDEVLIGALALDRPVLMVGDPGPVTTQRDFLVAQRAALHAQEVLRLGAEVELAIRPEVLAQLNDAAASVGRRTGTAEVADALELIAQRRRSLAISPGSTEEEGPAVSGPFELIGGGGASSSAGATAARSGPFESLGGDGGEARRPSEGEIASRPAGFEGAPSPRPLSRPPVTSSLSAAEAKDQLAALIVQERKLERSLEEAQREQERWSKRRELALQWGERDLATEAENILRRALTQSERDAAQLESVRLQKDKLKARVRGGRQAPGGRFGAPPQVDRAPQRDDAPRGRADKRFTDMEVEDDLARLRQRLLDELE